MKLARTISHVFILVSICVSVAAQKTNGWFTWGKESQLPVKGGLSHAVIGISNEALIIAGGSNFDKPEKDGGVRKIQHAVFVASDLNHIEWKQVNSLPESLSDAAVIPFKKGLLCIGGYNGKQKLNSVFLITWNKQKQQVDIDSSFPKFPFAVSSVSASKIGNTIYVAGGTTTENKPLNSFWSLDLDDKKSVRDTNWHSLANIPGGVRSDAAMVSQSNGEYDCVYLFGGKADTVLLPDAYKYDPKIKRWQKLADMPGPVLSSGTTLFGQSHILIFNSSHNQANGENDGAATDILAYHTITNTWIKAGVQPVGVAGASIVKWKNEIWMIGGETGSDISSNLIQNASVSTDRTKTSFKWMDYGTLILYLIALAYISYYFSKRKHTADDYLLGGKRVPFWAAGISTMATQVSAIGFMSIPAKAYAVNWAYFAGVFTWFIAVPIVNRAYIPFIRKLNVTSAYQYLEERFNTGARMFAASVFIFFQLARMGVVLYLPALALSAVTPLDTVTCIIIMGTLSTLYTVLGGIEGVIWIEVVQTILLFGGALICIVLAIAGTNGGVSDFFSTGIADHKFSLGEPSWDITSSGIFIILIGNIFNRVGNLTADQAVVQRYMTTSSTRQAQKTAWVDVAVSIPWAIVIYLLGTALYVFYKQHPAQLNPALGTDSTLPLFISQHAPAGLSGLIIAAIFAASMSSLEGSIHSVATIITTDFYGKFRKSKTAPQTLKVAQTATICLGVFATGLSLILVFLDIRSILDVFQELTGLFIGASTGLFMLGIFTKSANGKGALIGAVSSGVILYFVKTYTPVSFWLYSVIGFVCCYSIGYFASFFFKTKQQLQGLTYYTIHEQLKEK